ncbi:putative bifunctional diguanylate cyclase/phosphodiesterase [Pararhodospirillum photometricum]|uniref:PAS:GGDEF n=1 Tax=Pararhodospirillum photometricum DSM 122 TaxID=1150469 RepID=H6SQ04_PARPM|nr:bifunctional diguanylate cyclase/phosphodiesterase [Pararhodospirillum photometricum]CCG07274.1 PAS:GGDEF [Pararhodospirillum photometricum DSM 122]
MLKVVLIEARSASREVMSALQSGGETWGLAVTTSPSPAAAAALLTREIPSVLVAGVDALVSPEGVSLMAVALAQGVAVMALAETDRDPRGEQVLDQGAYECLSLETLTREALHRAIRQTALRAALDTLQETGDAGHRLLGVLGRDVRAALSTIVACTERLMEEADPEARRGLGSRIGAAATALEAPLADLSALERSRRHAGDLVQALGGGGVVIDMAPDLVCILQGGVIRHVNPAGAALLGVSPAALIGRRIEVLIHPDALGRLRDVLDRPRGGRRPVPAVLLQGDGGEVDVVVSVAPLGGRERKSLGTLVFLARDVSDRARAHREADRQAAFLRAVTDTMVDALIVADEGGRIERFNKAAERLFGVTAEDMIGRSINLLMPAQEARGHDRHLRTFMKSGCARVIGLGRELRARRLDGSEFPIELALSVVEQEGRRRFVAVVRDITERKEHEAQLVTLATRDPLTGLPNRVLLREHMEQALGTGVPFAVLFVDIDHFKKINDTLGHVVGDQVIRAMAQRLESHCQPHEGDMVAHLGGDEFTVIVGQVHDAEAVCARAEALMADLIRPYDVAGREVFTTVSVGAVCSPQDGIDVATLLRNVDTAVHHAKRQRRSSVVLYTPKLSADAVRRLHIETGLRRALERNEFDVHYQPKVDLMNGDILGAEALLRWDGRDVGKVSPMEFVPVAEETGLVQPIGEWVLRRACTQAALWRDRGLGPVRMGVNLSARQFNDPDLVTKVRTILEETGLDPSMLDLELTESMLVEDGDQVVAVLRRLKALGITLSIDDFGTGYSSFGYLKRFPIDFIKIDRSFVVDLPNNIDDMAITRAIASMASALRLRLVAEGVETNEQVAFLRTLGCDQGQGFLYSRPVPAVAFEALLRPRHLRIEGSGEAAPPQTSL